MRALRNRRSRSTGQSLPASALLLLPLAPHAGHGREEWSSTLWHWLLEPVHLPLTLLVLGLVTLGARTMARRRRVQGS